MTANEVEECQYSTLKCGISVVYIKIQYGIKGSQNTTIDIFVAQIAKAKNYMFLKPT